MLATQVCQRSPKVLPLIEKTQVLRGRKGNLCAEVAQGYGESKLLSGNSGKREKKLTQLCSYTSNCKSYHHLGWCRITLENSLNEIWYFSQFEMSCWGSLEPKSLSL